MQGGVENCCSWHVQGAGDERAVCCRESTGPGGPDIVFQHNGAWTMQAYARSASMPRGTVIAQVLSISVLLCCGPADIPRVLFLAN